MEKVKRASHSSYVHIGASLLAGAITMGVAAAVGKLWKNNVLKFWEIGLGMTAVDMALTFTALHLTLREDPPEADPNIPQNSNDQAAQSSSSIEATGSTPASSSTSHKPSGEDPSESDLQADGTESSSHETSESTSSSASGTDDILDQIGGGDDLDVDPLPQAPTKKVTSPTPPEPRVADNPPVQQQEEKDAYFGATKAEWDQMSDIEKATQKQVFQASLQSNSTPADSAAFDSAMAAAMAASLQDQTSDPVQQGIDQSIKLGEEEQLAAVIALSKETPPPPPPLTEPSDDGAQDRMVSESSSSSESEAEPPPEGQTLGSDAPDAPGQATVPDWLAVRQQRMKALEEAKKANAVATQDKVEEPAKQERKELRLRRAAGNDSTANTGGLVFGGEKKAETNEAKVLKVTYTKGQSLDASTARDFRISNADEVRDHRGPIEVPIEVAGQVADLGKLKSRQLILSCEEAPNGEQLQQILALSDHYRLTLKTAKLVIPADGSLDETQVTRLIDCSPYLESITMTPEQAEVILPLLSNHGHRLDSVQIVGGAIDQEQASHWVQQGFVDNIQLDVSACHSVDPQAVVAFNRAQGMDLVIPKTTDLSQMRTNNLKLVKASLQGFGDDIVRERYTGPVSYTPLISSDGRVLIRQGTRVIDSMTASLMIQWMAAEDGRSLANMPNAEGVQTVYLDDIPFLTEGQLEAMRQAFPNATFTHERCYGLEAGREADGADTPLSRRMRQAFRDTGHLNPYINGEVTPAEAVKGLIKVYRHAAHGIEKLQTQLQDAINTKEADTQNQIELQVFEYEKLQRQCIECLCRAAGPDTVDAIWKCAEGNQVGVLRLACYLSAKACGLENAEDFACDPTARESADFVFELQDRERHFQRWVLARSPWMRNYFLCPTKQSETGAIEEGLYYMHKSLRHIPDRDGEDPAAFDRQMNYLVDYLEGSLDVQALSEEDANALVPMSEVYQCRGLQEALLRRLNIHSYAVWLGRNLPNDNG